MSVNIHYENKQSLEDVRAVLSTFDGRPIEMQCQDRDYPAGYSYPGILIVEEDESLSIKDGSRIYENIDSMIADMETEEGKVIGVVFKVS